MWCGFGAKATAAPATVGEAARHGLFDRESERPEPLGNREGGAPIHFASQETCRAIDDGRAGCPSAVSMPVACPG